MLKTAHDLVEIAKQQICEVAPLAVQPLLHSSTRIIDVREPDEYAAGHLPGAVNIPRGMLEFKVSGEADWQNPEQAVLLYCKTSGRAALATCALQSLGFTQVRSMAGGFDAWQTAGLPIEKPALPKFD